MKIEIPNGKIVKIDALSSVLGYPVALVQESHTVTRQTVEEETGEVIESVPEFFPSIIDVDLPDDLSDEQIASLRQMALDSCYSVDEIEARVQAERDAENKARIDELKPAFLALIKDDADFRRAFAAALAGK